VVLLLETRDTHDGAVATAEEHDGEYLALQAGHEACPVAAGDYDPPAADADEEIDYEAFPIGGQPASEALPVHRSHRDDASDDDSPFQKCWRHER
jgi:hypothetical protein